MFGRIPRLCISLSPRATVSATFSPVICKQLAAQTTATIRSVARRPRFGDVREAPGYATFGERNKSPTPSPMTFVYDSSSFCIFHVFSDETNRRAEVRTTSVGRVLSPLTAFEVTDHKCHSLANNGETKSWLVNVVSGSGRLRDLIMYAFVLVHRPMSFKTLRIAVDGNAFWVPKNGGSTMKIILREISFVRRGRYKIRIVNGGGGNCENTDLLPAVESRRGRISAPRCRYALWCIRRRTGGWYTNALYTRTCRTRSTTRAGGRSS